MKALSIKQPYAELILQGKKTIELRKWNTKFRGTFIIHVPKSIDEAAMKKHGFAALPTGGIIGQVTLIDVKHYPTIEAHRADSSKHLASSDWGTYGFVLENPERLPFKPCKGKLNFWNYYPLQQFH